MKKYILILTPLILACQESSTEKISIGTDSTSVYLDSIENVKKAVQEAFWAEMKGTYVIKYEIENGAAEYYILNDDGTCSWRWNNTTKEGNYSLNYDGIMGIYIQGNTGTIEEIYSKNNSGLWYKNNIYLEKVDDYSPD